MKDLTSPNKFGPEFVKAGAQAGFKENNDFNGADQEGVGMFQVTHKNGERFSAAKAYLTPHLSRPNLHVITGAHTTRILMERKRAVGVEYSEGGEVKQLKCAREVLLCAGALQSPQLLMLSGIGHTRTCWKAALPPCTTYPGWARTCMTTPTWCSSPMPHI